MDEKRKLFYHRRSGSKNRLPENKDLNLEKRHPGRLNHAWMKSEIDKACEIAWNMDARDVNMAIRFGEHYGKGGQTRAIPLFESSGGEKENSR